MRDGAFSINCVLELPFRPWNPRKVATATSGFDRSDRSVRSLPAIVPSR